MPEWKTMKRARKAKREGKSPSTQAGEFVREEIHHVRRGKHGARSTKQAIAIGLSKARKAGVKLKPPRKGSVSEKTGVAQSGPIVRDNAGASQNPPENARALLCAHSSERVAEQVREKLSRARRGRPRAAESDPPGEKLKRWVCGPGQALCGDGPSETVAKLS